MNLMLWKWQVRVSGEGKQMVLKQSGVILIVPLILVEDNSQLKASVTQLKQQLAVKREEKQRKR